MISEGISPKEAQDCVDLLLSSEAFSRARVCRKIIQYTAARALAGASQVKEHEIAISAMDYGEDFDSRIQSNVRVLFSRVRARLQAYYNSEGRGDAIRITFPVGKYLPDFTRAGALPVEVRKLLRPEELAAIRRRSNIGASPSLKAALDHVDALTDALRQVERSCPCGARPESFETHPHVTGCPVGVALGSPMATQYGKAVPSLENPLEVMAP